MNSIITSDKKISAACELTGGIHPAENKKQSSESPIRFAGIPAELVLPLSQHVGAPSEVIISVGQKVLKGEMIAKPNGAVSAALHAPTSGVIHAIENRPVSHASGMSAPCIVLHSDGEDRWIEHSGVDNYQQLSASDLLARIRDAGIAGLGGAGFPSAFKLHVNPEKPIDTLIINGTECEPYITADDRLMRERAGDIINGIKILQHMIKPTQQTLLGIEDNKPEAIAALQQAASGSDIAIVVFPTKYPSGGEKQLIEILTGREVPSGGLPADIGIVCQNVGTTYAIARAILHGEPLLSRITTITGNACAKRGNVEVLLGTPIKFLLSQSDFNAAQCERLIIGGPMMGYTVLSTAVPIVKTTNCILAPTREELPPPPPAQACIRCGLCAEACPASLLPQQLYWFARSHENEKLQAHNLFDCIECGACSYVCPSSIPLVQYYRAAKADIRQQREEKIKADQSKLRFEARQDRIARLEAEKEAAKLARKQAAAARAETTAETDTVDEDKTIIADTNKQDAIQAAIERAKAKKAASSQATAPATNNQPDESGS